MNFRVFNDFKRRLLAGEVDNKFNCTAYLLNSAYETIMENNLYARDVNDFARANSAILRLESNTLVGNALENCSIYQNTYFRVPDVSEDDEDTGMYSIVNSANISAYSAMLGVDGDFSASRFNKYLQQYSYFYIVTRADEFARLVKDCKENDYETFAVVLADDIEHVVVDSTCFGSSRSKPFRGVFDGNGYTLHVAGVNAKQRSNGIFGYIAEEGTVRNLVIKADELSNNVNKAITVQNANTISLDTIKTGEGDVKIGVLAGVNNGTVENVLLSANIIYDGDYTPDVYFVQNKCNSTRVVSEAWLQLPAALRSSLANSTALSSFDNFFYPTQLCINSYANVIPYVGYFNEGCINHSTTDSDKLDDPMYTLQSGNTKYTSRDNSLYMSDIASFNYDKVYHKISDDDKIDETYVEYNDWYLNHTGYKSSNRISAATTFRMGPNNKQAYLLGALFGLNNGNLTNVAVKSVTTFETNTVALVGGIAGRGGRGILNGVYANTHFSAHSAMYEHYISVQSEPVVTASKQNVYLPATGTNLYNYQTPGTHKANIMYGVTGSDLSGTTAISGIYVAAGVDEDDIVAVLSADAEYEGTVTQNDYTLSAIGRNTTPLTSIFEDTVTPSESVKRLYSLAFTSANVINPNKIQLSAVFRDTNLNQDCTAACKIFNVEVADYYGLSKNVTALTSMSSLDSDCVYNYADGKTLTINPMLTIHFSGEYDVLRTVKGYVSLPIEDIDTGAVTAGTGNFTTCAYNTDFKIKLSPLVNIGGIFGEYVYSDAQQVINAAAHVSANNFKTDNGYNQANCLSYFAANLTFDSANKSNPDLYSATNFYSDHARVKNDLKCSACATDGAHLLSPFTNCSDMYTTAQFVHYLNMYNQIAPAIVSTQYTFNAHTKSKTEPPALGSMFTDFNFYQFGLNMGSNCNGYGDPYTFGNFLITNANTGIYFNFPAQLQYYNHKESTYAGNKSLWKYSTVITAAYNLAAGSTFTAFATKQLDSAPQHIPMYRGRSSIDANNENVTFNVTAYNNVSVTAPTGTVYSLNERIDDIATIIRNARSVVNDPIYIYSHSAENINTTINHVPLTMYYTDYVGAGTSAYDYTLDTDVINAWLTASNSARCYVLSSDSYTRIIKEPKYTSTRTYDDGTGVPISANSLIYGFIPTSADVVRALNVAEDATLLCSGIKADHINYLLVVDNAHRPIFDVELDVTAVDNDGYYIKFPQIYVEHITADSDASHSSGPRPIVLAGKAKLGGLAINIENGNN